MIKNFTQWSIISSASILLLSSCSSFYIPQTPIAPLFSAPKQAEANLNTGLNGFGVSAAYAYDSNLMITGSGYSLTSGVNKNYCVQAGVGYYKKFNYSKAKVYSLFEAEGGIGRGLVDVKYNSALFSTPSESGGYNKVYGKLAIGSRSDYHKISVQTYFSYLNTNNLMINNTKVGLKTNYLFFEPSATAALGYKYIMFTTSLGLCLPVNKTPIYKTDQQISYDVISFSMGMNISFKK